MSLWVVFLTGLTLGGISCLAVQGGLLASLIATRVEESLEKKTSSGYNIWIIATFLLAKLVVYTILGFLLGAFGARLSLSENIWIVMQLLAGLYMIATALNLLHVHPIFRFVVIQPPYFLTKRIRKQSRSAHLFAPALLGAMTIFIPCGTTLAIEAVALSSGSGINGALIMAVFVLATAPLFFSIGYLTTSLGEMFKGAFLKLAAIGVIYLGLAAINGSLVLLDAPITWQKIWNYSPIEINLSGEDEQTTSAVIDQTGAQLATIDVFGAGYKPDYLQVKAGVPVKLTLATHGGLGCTSQFKIPALNVKQDLPDSGSQTISFTPTQKGTYTWTCSMGMYTGTMVVS